MSRPTCVYINPDALVHNVKRVKAYVKDKKIIAMVKANAYGSELSIVLPTLLPHVDGFGVACTEEARAVRKLTADATCILFQGIFTPEELDLVVKYNLQCVIHQPIQLEWIVSNPLPSQVKVWVKVDTGMHRLGFDLDEVPKVMSALMNCPWVDDDIGLMTHLACADEPNHPQNQLQLERFDTLKRRYGKLTQSIANSAAIIMMPEAHAEVVRPGIMLYGISPFAGKIGQDFNLEPILSFVSSVTAIHQYKAHSPIGYGATWQSDKPVIIGVIPVGYGDGYPRHISKKTFVWIGGMKVPIVGRVSMDMLTVDLTNAPHVQVGDSVEMWGKHMPVEEVAASAGTIAYELICQVSRRVRKIKEVSQ